VFVLTYLTVCLGWGVRGWMVLEVFWLGRRMHCEDARYPDCTYFVIMMADER
jgi:hypothetical protein